MTKISFSFDRDDKKEWQVDRETLEIRKLSQYIKLQKIWSWIIGMILILSIIASWVFVYLLGTCQLCYKAYPGLAHVVVGSFFAQVVGLSYIVTKYLFPSK